MHTIKAFINDERGVTAPELVVLLGIVVVLGVGLTIAGLVIVWLWNHL